MPKPRLQPRVACRVRRGCHLSKLHSFGLSSLCSRWMMSARDGVVSGSGLTVMNLAQFTHAVHPLAS